MRTAILPTTLADLIQLCVQLGATTVGEITEQETSLIQSHPSTTLPGEVVEVAREQIRQYGDPLGDAYTTILSPVERRPLGQTYTSGSIVDSMVSWAGDQGSPARVVDPGAGSGRYLLAAARAFPDAVVIGSDVDPIATLMLRANIAVTDIGNRAQVILGDYRSLDLPTVTGSTLFIGNPPYVRHHQIEPSWKQWLLRTAAARGLKASGLAGLHMHFFLATAEHGRPGDYGAFITSAEWLDVNYGSLVRALLLNGLGGESLHVLEPDAAPFSDATTTGAITCFKLGTSPEQMRVRHVATVAELGRLDKGRVVSKKRLADTSRWSVLTRVTPSLPEGYVELGELCRVHRGAVTGANKVWVQPLGSHLDLPDSVLFPSVTKARDLFAAGNRLEDPSLLKKVIDLPVDLDVFEARDRRAVDRFLRDAKMIQAHAGYVASNRRAWWSVGLRDAAPILATYMARRPPAFVRNDVEARHINIAHGLYPREEFSASLLDALAQHLRTAVTLAQGRTYAGGLTKFEPKEMERLPVPTPAMLTEGIANDYGTATLDS